MCLWIGCSPLLLTQNFSSRPLQNATKSHILSVDIQLVELIKLTAFRHFSKLIECWQWMKLGASILKFSTSHAHCDAEAN